MNENLQLSSIEHISEPTFIFDSGSLEIVYANNSLLNLLIYEFSEIISLKIEKIIGKSSLVKIKEFIEIETKIDKMSEILFNKSDSSPITQDIVIYCLEREFGEYILIRLLNKDEIGEEIDFTKKSSQKIINDLPDPIIIADFSEIIQNLKKIKITNKKNLISKIKKNKILIKKVSYKIKFLFANRALSQFFQTEDFTELSHILIKMFDSENFDNEMKFLSAVLEKKHSFRINISDNTITKRKIYMKIFINTLKGYEENYERVLISFLDITKYSKTEMVIKRLDSRYRAIFESADIGIAIIDSKRRFIEVNKTLIEMSEFSKEELNEKKINDLLYLKRNQIFNKQIDDVFAKRKDYLKKEVKTITKSNEVRNWQFTITLIKSLPYEPQFCIALIDDFTLRRKIEKERKNYLSKIKSTEQRLRLLSKFLLSVQERERSYISKEMHDDIGQVLTAIKIELQSAIKLAPPEKIRGHLGEAINLVDYTFKRVRDMSMNLRPSIIDDLGLIPAIRWFLDKESQRNDLNIKFNSDFYSISIESEPKITSYRIIQEAVTNIIKHAETKNVWIDIVEKKEEILLVIVDDGIGFDIENGIKNAQEGKSMGLLSMMERAELLGGKLDFFSMDGKKGTVIKAHIRK